MLVQGVSARGSWLNAMRKNSSAGFKQREQEPLDGGPGVDDALAEHAVADVEQHAQADRHALVGEDRIVCSRPSSQIPNASRGRSGHQVPLGVEHRRRDHHEVDAGLEPARVADDLRRPRLSDQEAPSAGATSGRHGQRAAAGRMTLS